MKFPVLTLVAIIFTATTTNAQRIHKAKSVEELNAAFPEVNVNGLTFVIVRF